MTHVAAMFIVMAQIHNLPGGLQSAICFVESNHRVEAIHRDDGLSNSVGICQLQLPTARLLGFKGSEAQLQQVDVNIRLSATYLASLVQRYHGDIRKAVSAYNMGSWRVLKPPHRYAGRIANQSYVDKVFKAWGEGK